jgi:hypothetical protein
MNILDHTYQIVNSFTNNIAPDAFCYNERWQITRALAELISVSEIEDWLLTCCKQSSLSKYQLTAKTSGNRERALFFLLKKADENGVNIRADLGLQKHQSAKVYPEKKYPRISKSSVNVNAKKDQNKETDTEAERKRILAKEHITLAEHIFVNIITASSTGKKRTTEELEEAFRGYFDYERERILKKHHRARTTLENIFINIISISSTGNEKSIKESKRLLNNQCDYEKYIEIFHNQARCVTAEDFENHSYLAKKSKKHVYLSGNIRIYNNDLLIKSENTSAIQVINEDNWIPKCIYIDKRPEATTGKSKSYAQVSTATIKDGDDIYIVEGISTAFPFAYSGLNVFWAIDAGNLPSATAELRAKYPNSRLKIGADNDKKGAGLDYACRCGNVDILLPTMTDKVAEDESQKGVDWSDIWLESGDYGFYKELQLAEENRLIYPVPELFNTRYLSDFINIESLLNNKTVIKSTQETGKTTLALKLIKEAIPTGRVVYIAYSVALCTSVYEALKTAYPDKQVSFYKDYSARAEHLQCLNLSDIIVVTPESLFKILTATPIDNVIIDEISSVIGTFTSKKTHKSRLAPNREKLQEIIAFCKTLIAIDANITDGVKLFIENTKAAKGDFEISYCTNNFKFRDRTLNIYAKDHLMKLIFDAVDAKEKIVIPCTNKKLACTFYHYIKSIYPNKKILLFNSETNETPEAIELLKTRDATKYDIVIYTMAAGVGVDVNKHNFTKAFILAEHVHKLTAEKIRQLAQRFRNIKDYYISFCSRDLSSISHKYLQKKVSTGNEAEQIISITNNYKAEDIAISDDRGLAVHYPEIDKTLLNEIALNNKEAYKAAIDWNDLCIETFKEAGFKLKFHKNELTDDEVKTVKDKLKQGRELLLEATETEQRTLKPCSYQYLKTDTDRSNEAYKAKLKTSIAIITKDIENEIIRKIKQFKMFNNPKKYHKTYAVTKLMARNQIEHNQFVRERKTKDRTSYLIKEDFYNINRKMYKIIFDYVGYNPNTQKIEKEVWWSSRNDEEEIKEVLDRAGVEYSEKSYPVSVLHCILRDAGLTLAVCKRRIGKERFNEYSLNCSTIPQNIVKYIINEVKPQEVAELDNYLLNEYIQENNYQNNTEVDPPEAKTA